MAEGKMEITGRELAVFFGSVLTALFIMTGGALGWFDPLTAGIAVVTIVAFFLLAQWLEAKGVFGQGMSMVFVVFGLSVVMIVSGLISKGLLPLAFYSAGTPVPALVITNAMLYGLAIVLVAAVVVAVYVYKRQHPSA